MNLISEPWIPVVDQKGHGQSVSLSEIFDNGAEYRDLALPPPQRVAVMRLLICIAQAALDGPDDATSWENCEPELGPTASEYLRKHAACFELFGSQPFLQIVGLDPIDNATRDKLDFGLAAGNNDTLFDHAASPDGRFHSNAWLALNLLTFQCFSPGGTIGETTWNSKKTGRNSTSAPCVEASMLLALLRGCDLLTTVHSNLIPKSFLSGVSYGRPCWEAMPTARDCPAAAALTESYLGRLVPLSRSIQAFDGTSKLTLVNGLTYPKLPAAREPMATVRVQTGKASEEQHSYVRIFLARHPWRELQGVLTQHASGQAGGPLCLRNLGESKSVDLWVGGLATDKAKILDSAEWVFTLPAGLLGTTSLAAYGDGVQFAEATEAKLKFAIRIYGDALHLDSVDAYRREAITHFWSFLDARYEVLMDLCASEQDDAPWNRLVRRAAFESYRVACPHATPRQIQAFAQGQRVLSRSDKKKSKQEGDAA